MKKASLLLLISFLVFQVSANNATYNRLKKLYESDPAQCLIVAKKYIKRYPSKASPYYFATVVFQDKVARSKKARGKYFHMSKALGYAKTFNELEDFELQNKVDWEAKCIELEKTARDVVKELLETEDSDLGFRLEEKLNSYELNKTIYLAENENEIEIEIDTEVETETVAHITEETTTSIPAPEIVTIPGQFYGMPSGEESVKSYSLSNERELLKLINAERLTQGMPELVWEEDLARACRYHALDQGTQGYFNHDSYDRVGGELVLAGETFDRIRTFYKKPGQFVNSENIAAGNESAEDTYQQWYNSPGHYANMFNKRSTKVGIGVYRVPGSQYEYYWVFCTALDN
ncbi:MAG: hypothetical protein ACI837_002945 [Crocinitomicaceae bacterium]|jgi:uncharacterized protein YkwD